MRKEGEQLKRLSDIFDKASVILYKICTASTACAAAVMTGIVFVRVVMRYVFNSGFQWSEEISVLLMMWIAFFGGSLIFCEQGGISVTVLIDKLSLKKFRAVQILFHLMTLVFLTVLVIYGFKFAILGLKIVFGATGLPKFWSYLSIPVGAIFSIIFESSHLLHKLMELEYHKKAKEGSDAAC